MEVKRKGMGDGMTHLVSRCLCGADDCRLCHPATWDAPRCRECERYLSLDESAAEQGVCERCSDVEKDVDE